MSVKEAGRLAVVRRVLDGQLRQAQAARKLGLSVRQVKRWVRWRNSSAQESTGWWRWIWKNSLIGSTTTC